MMILSSLLVFAFNAFGQTSMTLGPPSGTSCEDKINYRLMLAAQAGPNTPSLEPQNLTQDQKTEAAKHDSKKLQAFFRLKGELNARNGKRIDKIMALVKKRARKDIGPSDQFRTQLITFLLESESKGEVLCEFDRPASPAYILMKIEEHFRL